MKLRLIFLFILCCSVGFSQEAPVFYESRCPFEMDFSLGFDDFRSLPEGSWNGNWGAYTSLNARVFFPHDLAAQIGGSFGLYDWAGRSFAPFGNASALQQQGFLTFAISRLAHRSGINAGIAYDWMLNKNFGIFALNPCFDQLRGQVGYLIEGSHELGVMASYGVQTVQQESSQMEIQFRGISQVNLFWCYYFKNNGFASLWAGTPYRRGLMYSSGRPGNYILGFQFAAPMTCFLSIEGHGAYMGPRGWSGETPSKNYASDLCIALTYSFGKRRVRQSPYMSIANNSNFLVDTNQNF